MHVKAEARGDRSPATIAIDSCGLPKEGAKNPPQILCKSTCVLSH